MRVNNSGVHIAREAEIVRVNNKPAQDLEKVQLDRQKLLGVCAKVL